MSARSIGLFLFVVLMLPVMPAVGAGLDDADERLFKVQLTMAEKGDSRAQYYLGEMHEQGLGTKQDVDEAFKWYAKAAERGDALAKRKLAHRKEIIDEIKQEQEAEKLGSSAPPARPENSGKAAKSAVSSKPAAVAQTDQARLEQEKAEKARAAERERRRAMVRAMILERMRHPVGEMFE